MKRKTRAALTIARDMGTVALMALINRLADATEKRNLADTSEEALNRKLLIASLIYHAIGIVYND
jgi:hypothetical protein